MNYDDLSLEQIKREWHGSLRSYMVGFITCLLLTGISFLVVAYQLLPEQTTIYTIAALALVQAIVQLRYFLHLGQEDKPKWETLIFYFMVMVLLIITIGSLWIMNDLHKRVMSNISMDMHAHD